MPITSLKQLKIIGLRVSSPSHILLKLKLITLAIGAFAFFSPAAIAQTKCVDAKGKVTYSDTPCPTNTVQKTLSLSGVGAPAQSQSGNADLDKLNREQRRLKLAVDYAEADLRSITNSNYLAEGKRKLSIAKADLLKVQEQILQITDPAAYQQYLSEKKDWQRDQQLSDAQNSANDARARAAAAEQSANNANARAIAAQQSAAVANARAANAEQNSAAAQDDADSAVRAAKAAQGAASRPMYCRGGYCYPN